MSGAGCRRSRLAVALTALLLSLGSQCDGKRPFPPVVPLASLDGDTGFRVVGSLEARRIGSAVSGAGDVNGDGVDDLLVGAPWSEDFTGHAYVIFGRQGFSASVDPVTLDGSNGFAMRGPLGEELYAGGNVSDLGDVNGDGVDDVAVLGSGSTWVVFGTDLGFPPLVELANLGTDEGFVFLAGGGGGSPQVDRAGDVNGDGLEDFVVAAPAASEAYVVFGSEEGFPAALDPRDLDGSNGFTIEAPGWVYSVAGAGDVNADGFRDVVLTAAPDYSTHVVLGSEAPFPSRVAVDVNGGPGSIAIVGDGAARASGAGDVNGDGIDDLVVMGSGPVPENGIPKGAVHVIHGSPSLGPVFDVGTLQGPNGFTVVGTAEAGSGQLGFQVTGADLNGDGLSDVVSGDPWADATPEPNAPPDEDGSVFVLFGRVVAFPPEVPVSSLDGWNGFRADGVAEQSFTGREVSSAGDVNGDGIEDLVVGAPDVDSEELMPFHGDLVPIPMVGEAYVVFGRR